LSLVGGQRALAQETPVAFVNARIIPIEGDEIERGVMVVHLGRILAIGPAASTSVPQGASTVDLAGKTIMPGLVDTHSHIGGVGAADSSGAIQPEVRVFDSINVRDSGFRRAVAGGLTALNIMPGSGHLLSGQTIYVKLRAPSGSPPARIEDLFIRDAQGQPMWGIKMANGTNPLRDPPFPGTRGKAAAMVRQRFIQAQEYRAKLNAARREDGTLDPDKAPARDLALEALVDVLEGKRIVHHHTHRADDIMTVLRLQREFGFRVVLHHVSEAWKVPTEIAQAGVSCSVIVVDSPGGKLEALNLSWETCGTLERAGAAFSIHTDDWITDSRLFLRSGALAIRGGASRAAVLRGLTLEGAAQMDLQDRIGSLKPGKDADFIVLSGDPFSVYTRVEQTYVEGVKVFDLSNPEDRLFAVGGFGAGRDQEVYLCCVGQSGFTFGGKSWGMGSGQNAGGGQ
jgi:imidazolonepropionase-like amidohydrolase